jgi:hypothetical protein
MIDTIEQEYYRMSNAFLTKDQQFESLAVPQMMSALRKRYGGVYKKSPLCLDRNEGTDYRWVQPGAGKEGADMVWRIACRARRAKFLCYRNDFTIREERPRTASMTELEKIKAHKWAGLYLYGFCDDRGVPVAWSLYQMRYFNAEASFSYMPGYGPHTGRDTVTRVYSALTQPAKFIINTSENITIETRETTQTTQERRVS